MFYGFYTAASGMLMNQRSLNVLTNNFANVETPGFKAERVVSTTFQQEYLTRIEKGNNEVVGMGSPVKIVESVPTLFDPSFLEDTQRPFDMAVVGEGFFCIDNNGEEVLTRNGNFNIDDEGYLVLRGVGRVRDDENQPIPVEGSYFTVNRDGDILDEDNDVIARIKIAQPDNLDGLQKLQNGMYANPNGVEYEEPENYSVAQGVVERSNIDLNHEFALSMEVQRSFQACSTALRVVDQMNSKTANELMSL